MLLGQDERDGRPDRREHPRHVDDEDLVHHGREEPIARLEGRGKGGGGLALGWGRGGGGGGGDEGGR